MTTYRGNVWVAKSTVALAQGGTITRERARRWQADLNNLPPLPSVADLLGLADRLRLLDEVMQAAIHSHQQRGVRASVVLSSIPSDESKLLSWLAEGFGLGPARMKAYQLYSSDPRMDWDEALRYANTRCDRFRSVFALPSYRKCRHASDLFAAECKELAGQAMELASLPRDRSQEEAAAETFASIGGNSTKWREHAKQVAEAIDHASLRKDVTSEQISRHFVDVRLELDWIYGTQLLNDHTTLQTYLNLAHLALALAAYHHDHGSYPKNLSELAPKYIARVPNDPFADEALRYGRRIGGYLLYSVGPNGKDDGGRNFNEEADQTGRVGDRSWDDIGIRMPPRKLETSKER
jgi:hypothetical protein